MEINLENLGKNLRLDVYSNDKEEYLNDTVLVKDYKNMSEGEFKKALIHHLIKVKAESGWYTFYLYEADIIMYCFYFNKRI